MKRLSIIVGSAFILATTTASAVPIEWDVASGGNGNWYELILQPGLTWSEANSAANALGTGWHLATVTSANENAFVESLLNPGPPTFEASCLTSSLVGRVCEGIWLGGFSSSNSANDWQWVTGEAFSFSDWGPFEPFRNGDRLEIAEFRDRGRLIAWNDVPGSRTRSTGYIVEHEGPISASVPEPSSILLMLIGVAALSFAGRKSNLQLSISAVKWTDLRARL